MSNVAQLFLVGIAGIHAFGTMGGNSPEPSDLCDPGEIIFAIEPNWGDWSSCVTNPIETPYSTWNGMCEGAVPELYKAVCEAEGLECKKVITQWANIWEGDGTDETWRAHGWGSGEFHVAAAARNTAPRQAVCMQYSNPWSKPGNGLLMAAHSISSDPDEVIPPFSFNDMSGKTVCAETGFAIGEDYINRINAENFDNTMNPNGIVITFSSAAEATQAVIDGTCDYVIFDGDQSEGALNGVWSIPVFDADGIPGHNVGGVSYMVDGRKPESACILRRLNRGIQSLRDSGQLQAILAGHPLVDAPAMQATYKNNPDLATCAQPMPM